MVVLGVTIGSAVGWLENLLLFRAIDRALREGREPLSHLGGVFFARFAVDILFLLIFWYVTHDHYGLIAAALSIALAIQVSLLVALRRKGGRFH